MRIKALILVTGLLATALSCDDDEPAEAKQDSAATSSTSEDASVSTASPDAGMCVKEESCQDLLTSFFQYPSCCSPNVTCGYEITFDDAFFELYPQARDIVANLTSDDPAGKCVPEKYVFPELPGTYDHRVELEGPEENDILVAKQCESRGFWVFTMPGCCMPDNRCGISTDEVAPTFELLLEGESAPFAKPECVTADELNNQFKASSLEAFARIRATSGAPCDHQALAQAIPRYKPMNQSK
jgi:hypothetical protein